MGMSDESDKRIRKAIDRVLERIIAEAKRRGINTEGKSIDEIRKALAELGSRRPKSSKRLKRPRDPIQRAKLIGDIATGQIEDVEDIVRLADDREVV